MKKKRKGSEGGEGVTRVCFAKRAGWGAASKVQLCCARREWRNANWQGEKRTVVGRGGKVYMGVDGV